MDWEFVKFTMAMLLVNLTYSIIALFIGVVAIRLLDRVILRKIDLEEEIQKGNLAASIFASTLLLFVAVTIGMALSK